MNNNVIRSFDVWRDSLLATDEGQNVLRGKTHREEIYLFERVTGLTYPTLEANIKKKRRLTMSNLRTIFLRDGELYLIQGEVPKKLKNLCHHGGFSACPMPDGDPCGCQKDINEYHVAISKLKSEAIRIGNKDEAMPICLRGHKPTFDPKMFMSDFLYEIDAEVEIEENCYEPCDCTERCEHWEKRTTVAILRPVKQETSEDEDFIWNEVQNRLYNDDNPAYKDHEWLKANYKITRK